MNQEEYDRIADIEVDSVAFDSLCNNYILALQPRIKYWPPRRVDFESFAPSPSQCQNLCS
jgi:hypothetical protein